MEYIKIKEFAKVVSGSTPKTNVEEYWNGQYPWITPAELDKNTQYIYETRRKLTDLGVKSANLNLLKKGSVLLTSRAPIGKVAIAGINLYCNQGFKNLVCNEQIIVPQYLYYWLSSKVDYLNSLGRGATFKEISKSIVEEIEVPIHKLEIQQKIANILDKAQSLIDKRKEQIEACDELVKSLFYEMFGDPVKNDKHLPKIKLQELGEWKSGGTPSRSNNNYYNGNIPWLSSGELNSIYTQESNEYITEDAVTNSSAKLIPVESLLLGMYDTAALKSTINLVECTCNQAIVFAKLNDAKVSTVFIYYCIQIGKEFYKSQQRGVRQKNLNLSMVKDMEVLFPPLPLQNKFAAQVEKIEQQKTLLEQSLKELENNFKSLMQRAFKGELF